MPLPDAMKREEFKDNINQRNRPVIATTPDGKEMHFDTVNDAVKYFGASRTSIDLALKGISKKSCGCTWRDDNA